MFWAPFRRSATRKRRRVIFTRRSPRDPGVGAGAAAAAGAGAALAAAGAGAALGVGGGVAGAAGSAAFSAFCMYNSGSYAQDPAVVN